MTYLRAAIVLSALGALATACSGREPTAPRTTPSVSAGSLTATATGSGTSRDVAVTPAPSWDAAADFSATANPNGPWVAGYRPAGGGLGAFHAFTEPVHLGPYDAWLDPNNDPLNTPLFAKNVSTSASVGVQPGQVDLHPGCNAGEPALLRWTAPSTGTWAEVFHVHAQFFSGDLGNTNAAITMYSRFVDGVHEAVYATASTNSNPVYDGFVTVVSGTIIEFEVGTGGDGCGYDTTPLNVTITEDRPPTISTGGPYSGNAGTAVPLSIQASDPDGEPLTYAWDLGDGTTGQGSTPPSSHVYAKAGSYTITLRVSDGHNSVSTSTTATINPPDVTPPVITPTITGTSGTNGWYTSDVTIHWAVTDAESPVSSKSGCDDVTLSANTAGETITCSATSAGGTASKSFTVKIDRTVPTVSGRLSAGVLGTNGWYVSPVSVTWTPSAAGPSGQFLSSDCAANTLGVDTPSHTFTCTVTTGAGISSMQGQLTVKLDRTPPVVTYSNNIGSYTVDQTVAITCQAYDATSGVASTTCANLSGDAYDFALGVNRFSASATDRAGNTGTGSTEFTVSVTPASLCVLVDRFVTNLGEANSLCAKLRAMEASRARGNTNAASGQLDAFIHEVEAQSGKALSPARAELLVRLANALARA